MVVDPYVLNSHKSPSEFEAMIREDFKRLLQERRYPQGDTIALLTSFDTAAELHRRKDERRKVPKPFWVGDAGGEPYISHIGRVLNFMLIEPAFDYRLDPALLSAACFHDTIETLIEKESGQFTNKELALDYVKDRFQENLNQAGMPDFISTNPGIRSIVNSLSRNHDEAYYKSIGQIFSQEPENIMRALIIKGFDRIDNNIDLQDLSLYSDHWRQGSRVWPEIFTDLKKTLKSYFKTLFVANEIKRHAITSDFPKTPLLSNLMQMPKIIATNMKFVYDIISGTLREYVESLPGEKGAMLMGEIAQAKQEMAEYMCNGGFEKVTSEGELHSRYDGTIRRYDDFLRNRLNWCNYKPTPLEIYRDARSIQTLLHLLSRPDKPDYYLHGFEFENFYKQ